MTSHFDNVSSADLKRLIELQRDKITAHKAAINECEQEIMALEEAIVCARLLENATEENSDGI